MQTTSDIIPQAAIDTGGPRGLGGWLLLPILYLITVIVLSAYNYFLLLWDWEGVIALATGQIDPDYQWLLWPMLLSTVMGVGIIAFAIYLLVILFQKKRELRLLAVWFYSALLIVMVIEFGISAKHAEFTQTAEYLKEAGSKLYHTVLVAPVWISYFLRSKRVKATFVN